MADTIGDLLKKRGSSSEPEDFLIIRKYIQDRFDVTPKLSIAKNGIKIGVPNASIATNLRFELYDLSHKLKSKLRLTIVIIK